ncbi:MAG: ATP-dependent DNA ligase, partial [Marmoricola sp.]|nr:ATP-dependent DNA ligase [Marmoricola sp.]
MPASKEQRTETPVEVEGHRITLVNLEKVMYPRTGTTKGEVLNYYAQVSGAMLPHLRDRAVTRIRWPHGTGDMSFFEKNTPQGTPRWVRTATVPTTGSRTRSGEAGELTFPIIDDLATLTWAVNLAALELHVHQWTVTKKGGTRNPNRLVVDLDPGDPAGLMECSQVALLVRERLAAEGLDDVVPVTSGSKGIHLYARLDGRRTSDEVRDHAKEIAEELESSHKALVVSQMTKARRGGKV